MTGFMISSAIEIMVCSFIIFGLFNEEKLAVLEGKLFSSIRERFGKKGGKKRNIQSRVRPTAGSYYLEH